MSAGIIKFEGSDGQPVLVNPAHVAFATRAVMNPQNGNGPRQVAVGLCAIAMINGQIISVKASSEELYRLLKGSEFSIARDV